MPAQRKFRLFRHQAYVLTSAVAANVLGLALPLVLMQVYDRILPNEGYATLIALMVGLAVAVLLEFLLRLSHGRLLTSARALQEVHLTRCMHHALLRDDVSDVEKLSFGGYMDRLAGLEDLNSPRHGDATSAIVDVPFAFLFLGFIVLIAPPIGVLVAILLLFAALTRRRIARTRRSLTETREESEGRRMAFLIQLFGSIETTKSLGMMAFMERRYERLLASNATTSAAIASNTALIQGINASVTFATPILVAGGGAWLVINDQLTIGALAATILLASRAVQQIMRFNEQLEGRHAAARVSQGREAKPALAAPARVREIGVIDRLQAEGLTFAARAAREPLLQDACFELRRGEAVALRGSVGSGKTAVMNMIAGHQRPDAGSIRLNGIELGEIDPASLRRQMAYLQQQHTLLEGTLLENMTRFRPELYSEEAITLAEDLGLARFVDGHHSGLATPVRRGVSLGLPSAIVDRIAVIAGLVGRPSLILFDEANLSLDTDGDVRLREVLQARKAEAAIFMVTQRPSYLAICDRGYRLEGGRIVPDDLEDVRPAAAVPRPPLLLRAG